MSSSDLKYNNLMFIIIWKFSFYCYRFCYMYPKCKPLHFSSRHLKSLLNLTSIHMCHHLQMMHLWIQIRFPNEVQCNDLNTSVISTRVTWALPTAIRFKKYCKKPWFDSTLVCSTTCIPDANHCIAAPCTRNLFEKT